MLYFLREEDDIEQSSNSKGRERERESTVGISCEDKDRLPFYPFSATFNESIHLFFPERREAGISIRDTERAQERGW